jgi:hypothetical protein
MLSTPSKPQTLEEHITYLRQIIDKLTTSMATIQRNQGQLTVAMNWMQSNKLLATDTTDGLSFDDAIAPAASHGHKLLFPTYGDREDPLAWLNRCDQFFHIQSTAEADKVFLATFHMIGDA